MIFACRLVVALALGGLVCPPVYADVIPSRRASEAGDSSAQKVESRLMELGVQAGTARTEVNNLTSAETRYFAQSPERLQLVGQEAELWAGQSNNFWWEWIGGIALLVGVTAFIYAFAKTND